MKTSEFIEKIEILGFYIKDFDSNLKITNSKSCIYVADVSKSVFGMISTNYQGFTLLDNGRKLYLLDILIKYATTPPEEREDEKKYYLKLKGFSNEEETYLCAYDFWSDWILIDKDSLNHGDEFYFKFTQSEIDELPECYTHPAVWEQEEVESEEEC